MAHSWPCNGIAFQFVGWVGAGTQIIPCRRGCQSRYSGTIDNCGCSGKRIFTFGLTVPFRRRGVTFTGGVDDYELIEVHNTVPQVYVLNTFGGGPIPLGGSFTLSHAGLFSVEVPYTISDADFETMLRGYPELGRVHAASVLGHDGRTHWTLTFRWGRVVVCVVDVVGVAVWYNSQHNSWPYLPLTNNHTVCRFVRPDERGRAGSSKSIRGAAYCSTMKLTPTHQ